MRLLIGVIAPNTSGRVGFKEIEDLRIFCLNEKAEWKKSTGNFGNWVDYRLDDMSLERSCLEPTSVGYSDYSLHPLMLFSDTRFLSHFAFLNLLSLVLG